MKSGEIWDINFSPQVGDEIKKTRPAIIVNNDAIGKLELKVVIPVTDGLRTIKQWHVELIPSKQNGLDKTSIADCFQIKSISKMRFIKKRGALNEQEMDEIKLTLMKVLDLL